MSLFIAAALAAAAPASAIVQPAPPPSDPFAGMTIAGHAKAEALNRKLEADLTDQGKRMAVARKAFQDAVSADPLDMDRVQEAARAYEDGLSKRGDGTMQWVALAATLDPADRAYILKRLPRVGGVMSPPPQPPLPPRRPGF